MTPDTQETRPAGSLGDPPPAPKPPRQPAAETARLYAGDWVLSCHRNSGVIRVAKRPSSRHDQPGRPTRVPRPGIRSARGDRRSPMTAEADVAAGRLMDGAEIHRDLQTALDRMRDSVARKAKAAAH
jgi:hypothetical protein